MYKYSNFRGMLFIRKQTADICGKFATKYRKYRISHRSPKSETNSYIHFISVSFKKFQLLKFLLAFLNFKLLGVNLAIKN